LAAVATGPTDLA